MGEAIKPSNTSKTKCRYCGEEFTSVQAVNSHIGKAHLDKKTQKFIPSKNQLKALGASMDMDTKPTITAFMDKAGIERKQWYRWIERPEFVAWWNAKWEEYMGAGVFHLDKISYMKASKDYRYMELLQMKYGKFRRNADVTTGGEQIKAGIFVEWGDEDEDIQTS